MHNIRRDIGVSVVLLALVGATWWLNKETGPASSSAFQEQGEVDAYLGKFVVTTMDVQGQPSYRMAADKMIYVNNSKVSQVELPLITVYRQNGTPWLVRAQHGQVHSDTDVVFLNGDVRMTNIDEAGNTTQVLTEKLEVHPKAQYAQTEEAVVVHHYRGQASGVGMQANLIEGKLSLLQQVKGYYETARH